MQLIDYNNNEVVPTEEVSFPQLTISTDPDGCGGPLLECGGEKDMTFQTVSGKLLYRACIKDLNKKILSGRMDTPWRSALGFSNDH